MQFQMFTDYALRILQYLHTCGREGATIMDISRATNVSNSAVRRIIIRLSQHGLLLAVHNPKGSAAYALAKPAAEISAYDIFLAIEGSLHLLPQYALNGDLLSDLGAVDQCSTHSYFRALQNVMISFMSRQNVADFSQ